MDYNRRMELLAKLNEAQRAAVSAPAGPVLVLAGPGSGKTRVLTHRIAYLIQEMKVPAWHILAVTFTNKAAREMEHRVEGLLGGRPDGLTMGTFHAICARILRRESDNLPGYTRDFAIFDSADQLQVVKQVLNELNIDDKKFQPGKLLNAISSAKNELITAAEYMSTNYIAEVTRRVYERYQATLQANNAMDFDDLLMNTVLLFDERPDILHKYQTRYSHILVDEFQDTNTTQYALLTRLVGENNGIFVVGDMDQSIYKWRGADYRNIERFRHEFPDTEMILLEQNYRSTQLILDAAMGVIRHNQHREHKQLFTTRTGGAAIVVREAYNEQDEAAAIVNTIQNLMLQGYGGDSFAVMYRTNAQSRALEEAFVLARLPYKLVGATQFYQRREVKDALAYLRVINNLRDEVSFNRILNTPTRGIGTATQQQLNEWAASKGLRAAEALLDLARRPDQPHPFKPRPHSLLTQFGNMLDAWVQLREVVGVGEMLDVVLEQTRYREYIDDGTDEGEERWQNVMELRGVAGADAAVSLSQFLEQVSLVSETDNLEEAAQATTLLTLHAAKGLEYPVVFITGLEEGVLPHSRSLDDKEELAEERRLFYVGITRAKDQLYLSHTFRRTTWGDSSVAFPSRFLNDIPPELIDGSGTGERRRQSKQRASTWDPDAINWPGAKNARPAPRPTTRPIYDTSWNPPPAKALPTPYGTTDKGAPKTAPSAPTYRTGQKVRHAKFGEGIVIESKLTGTDEEVSVAFTGLGVKRLAASFAALEVVDQPTGEDQEQAWDS